MNWGLGLISLLLAAFVSWHVSELVTLAVEELSSGAGRRDFAKVFKTTPGLQVSIPVIIIAALATWGASAFVNWATGYWYAFLLVFSATFAVYIYKMLRNHGWSIGSLLSGIGAGILGYYTPSAYAWLGIEQPTIWAVGTAIVLICIVLVWDDLRHP
ncbi:MAG: hypothetical protein Q7S01_03835 [bacterium]|nr:hypothetical protein [bacterium]